MLAFVERICVEFSELKDREEKLAAFLVQLRSGAVKVKDEEDFRLLKVQLEQMQAYLITLSQRLARFTSSEDLALYTKGPRCQNCKWAIASPLVEYCGCMPMADSTIHRKHLLIARALHTLYPTA